MRRSWSTQQRMDCTPVEQVVLNYECRDEIIPILAVFQYIYSKPDLRDAILGWIARDVNRDSRRDIGREGFDDWQILVLAAVRLGCNLNYDKLQDLAEQHRALRHIMGVGDWDGETSFNWRRVRNTLCLLTPETLDQISQLIVTAGHTLTRSTEEGSRRFVCDRNQHSLSLRKQFDSEWNHEDPAVVCVAFPAV